MTIDWNAALDQLVNPHLYRNGRRRAVTSDVSRWIDDGLLVPLERLRREPWYRRSLEEADREVWEAGIRARLDEALLHLVLRIQPVMRLDEFPCAKYPYCGIYYHRWPRWSPLVKNGDR